MRQAIAIATKAHNEVDRVNGFTPTQWILGRNPTWTGELHDEPEDRVNIARDAQEQFAARLKTQIEARRICEEEMLKQRILRAQRAQTRTTELHIPGETVFAWLVGAQKKMGMQKGTWYGPGTVLGTETRNGEPISIIWVVMNGRLWRCAPQQLRKASERE